MGADDNLPRHAAACQAVAADYIERSTRFSVRDVRFTGARSTLHTFTVAVAHRLSVGVDEEDRHGRHHPGHGDFGTADWQWYQQEVAAQSNAELTRGATLDELAELVRSQRYAAIGTRTRLRTHPRRLFHTYTCKRCSGHGDVTCDTCHGKGKVACTWCAGSGKTHCSQCGGSGSTTETRQVSDYNGYTRMETQHRTCPSCSGGRVNCGACWGTGRKGCGSCGGSGRLACGACSGHGCLTRISTTHTFTTPHFAPHYAADAPAHLAEAVAKMGIGAIERHGRVALRDVDIRRNEASVLFVYECRLLCCELSIDVCGVASRWVLYGAEPHILDAGGALEALLQSDLHALAGIARGAARWLPWYHRRAAKSVGPFMESELNQLIVDESRAGKGVAAIVEQASRSVSSAYVTLALAHLRQVARAAGWWSRIKWFVALHALALPVALAAFRYRHGDVSIVVREAAARYDIVPPQPGGVAWELALLSVPFTLAAGCVARWTAARWLKRAGGARTVAWARMNGLLPGAVMIVLTAASAAALTGTAFGRLPPWVDGQGKAFGLVPFYSAPVVLPPAPAVEKPRPARRRKKAPRVVPPRQATAAESGAAGSGEGSPVSPGTVR